MSSSKRVVEDKGSSYETRERRQAEKAIARTIRGLNHGTHDIEEIENIDIAAACVRQKRKSFR